MQLEERERLRKKAYTQYLKEEAHRQIQLKKETQNHERKQQQTHFNGLVRRLNEDDARRVHLRKNNAQLSQQQNLELSQLKKNTSKIEGNLSFSQSSSFPEQMLQNDKMRYARQQNDLKNQHHHNYKQFNERRLLNQQSMQEEINSEIKHMQRVKQINDENERKYRQILKNHEQNMNLYNKHNQLLQENDQHRKSIQKFTDTNQGIFHHIWRNEENQRKKAYLETQQLLKKQIDQFNKKKTTEKSTIPDDLEKSIFRSVHRHPQRNQSSYGSDLKVQMDQMEKRKQQEKKNFREKVQINGVYGGQHDRERSYQIQIIDKSMGLIPKGEKEMPKKQKRTEKPFEQVKQLPSATALENKKFSLVSMDANYSRLKPLTDRQTPQVNQAYNVVGKKGYCL